MSSVTGVAHHHSHGPANRGRRVLRTAAPLFVVEPPGPIRGGVVVLHDVPGLTEHIERYCRWLAADGWLAVAPYHYYESGGRGSDDPEVPRYARTAVSQESLHTDVHGALNYLAERRGLVPGSLSALGFGSGADLASWAGTHHALAAAVAVGAGGEPGWSAVRELLTGGPATPTDTDPHPTTYRRFTGTRERP